MNLEVYADGSATTVDKPGGYGFVVVKDGEKLHEGSGHMEMASNNDAELSAAIEGLACVLRFINDQGITEYQVTLVSDSQLILGWANGSFRFKQKEKMDKYENLLHLMTTLNAKTRWIRGHSGDEHNERCDFLANQARKKEDTQAETKKSSKIKNKKRGTLSVWYKDILHIIDFDNLTIERYNREIHGARGSFIEIREDKRR